MFLVLTCLTCTLGDSPAPNPAGSSAPASASLYGIAGLGRLIKNAEEATEEAGWPLRSETIPITENDIIHQPVAQRGRFLQDSNETQSLVQQLEHNDRDSVEDDQEKHCGGDTSKIWKKTEFFKDRLTQVDATLGREKEFDEAQSEWDNDCQSVAQTGAVSGGSDGEQPDDVQPDQWSVENELTIYQIMKGAKAEDKLTRLVRKAVKTAFAAKCAAGSGYADIQDKDCLITNVDITCLHPDVPCRSIMKYIIADRTPSGNSDNVQAWLGNCDPDSPDALTQEISAQYAALGGCEGGGTDCFEINLAKDMKKKVPPAKEDCASYVYQIEDKNKEIAQKVADIASKDAEITSKQGEIDTCNQNLVAAQSSGGTGPCIEGSRQQSTPQKPPPQAPEGIDPEVFEAMSCPDDKPEGMDDGAYQTAIATRKKAREDIQKSVDKAKTLPTEVQKAEADAQTAETKFEEAKIAVQAEIDSTKTISDELKAYADEILDAIRKGDTPTVTSPDDKVAEIASKGKAGGESSSLTQWFSSSWADAMKMRQKASSLQRKSLSKSFPAQYSSFPVNWDQSWSASGKDNLSLAQTESRSPVDDFNTATGRLTDAVLKAAAKCTELEDKKTAAEAKTKKFAEDQAALKTSEKYQKAMSVLEPIKKMIEILGKFNELQYPDMMQQVAKLSLISGRGPEMIRLVWKLRDSMKGAGTACEEGKIKTLPADEQKDMNKKCAAKAKRSQAFKRNVGDPGCAADAGGKCKRVAEINADLKLIAEWCEEVAIKVPENLDNPEDLKQMADYFKVKNKKSGEIMLLVDKHFKMAMGLDPTSQEPKSITPALPDAKEVAEMKKDAEEATKAFEKLVTAWLKVGEKGAGPSFNDRKAMKYQNFVEDTESAVRVYIKVTNREWFSWGKNKDFARFPWDKDTGQKQLETGILACAEQKHISTAEEEGKIQYTPDKKIRTLDCKPDGGMIAAWKTLRMGDAVWGCQKAIKTLWDDKYPTETFGPFFGVYASPDFKDNDMPNNLRNERVYGYRLEADEVFDWAPSMKGVVLQAQSGYSVVMFGYGYSGAGKTFTLLGGKGQPGVMTLGVAEMQLSGGVREMSVSFKELYGQISLMDGRVWIGESGVYSYLFDGMVGGSGLIWGGPPTGEQECPDFSDPPKKIFKTIDGPDGQKFKEQFRQCRNNCVQFKFWGRWDECQANEKANPLNCPNFWDTEIAGCEGRNQGEFLPAGDDGCKNFWKLEDIKYPGAETSGKKPDESFEMDKTFHQFMTLPEHKMSIDMKALSQNEDCADVGEWINRGLDVVQTTRQCIDCRAKMMKNAKYAEMCRHVRATPNNPESSRGHLFVILDILFEPREDAEADEEEASKDPKTGRIVIVDCAGSEDPISIIKDYVEFGGATLNTAASKDPTKARFKLGTSLNSDDKPELAAKRASAYLKLYELQESPKRIPGTGPMGELFRDNFPSAKKLRFSLWYKTQDPDIEAQERSYLFDTMYSACATEGEEQCGDAIADHGSRDDFISATGHHVKKGAKAFEQWSNLFLIGQGKIAMVKGVFINESLNQMKQFLLRRAEKVNSLMLVLKNVGGEVKQSLLSDPENEVEWAGGSNLPTMNDWGNPMDFKPDSPETLPDGTSRAKRAPYSPKQFIKASSSIIYLNNMGKVVASQEELLANDGPMISSARCTYGPDGNNDQFWQPRPKRVIDGEEKPDEGKDKADCRGADGVEKEGCEGFQCEGIKVDGQTIKREDWTQSRLQKFDPVMMLSIVNYFDDPVSYGQSEAKEKPTKYLMIAAIRREHPDMWSPIQPSSEGLPKYDPDAGGAIKHKTLKRNICAGTHLTLLFADEMNPLSERM